MTFRYYRNNAKGGAIYSTKPMTLTRVNFTQITNNKISQYYDRMYKYNPEGQLKHFDNSRTSILQLTKNLTRIDLGKI